MATTTLSPSERAYILAGLQHPAHPTRLDGRPLVSSSTRSAYRSLQISRGDAPQSNGSARVVLGGTEVVVGVKLEVVDSVEKDDVAGKEGWRAVVEVDVTPSAYPQYAQSSSTSTTTGTSSTSASLSQLSTYYTNLVHDHFVPYLPPLTIVEGYKYFQPLIHITVLSTSSGSTLHALIIALRTAFTDLRVPRTKCVGWEGVSSVPGGAIGVDAGMGVGASVGAAAGGAMKAALTKKGGRLAKTGKERSGPGEEWDLVDSATLRKSGKTAAGGSAQEEEEDDGDDDGVRLPGSVRNGLPVVVTLNLIPASPHPFFLDATPAEELACPSRLHVFFCGRPSSSNNEMKLKVCGTRIEGDGIKIEKLPRLLQNAEEIAKEMMDDVNAASEVVIRTDSNAVE